LGKTEHKKFEENINFLGNVELILGKHQDFNGRISFFRKSNMLIDTKTRGNPNHSGYAGVFICEDLIGNKILKRVENPRHDEWAAKNYKHREGGAALKCLEEFISKCYKDFFFIQEGNEVTISKLNEFLQIDLRENNNPKRKSFAKSSKTIKESDKKPTVGGGGDKRIRSLRCYAKKNRNGQWEYQIRFVGVEDLPVAFFEVLVGGDNDKAGIDNVIPLFSFNNIVIEEKTNQMKTLIKIGVNEFSFVLNDEEKHSLRLKLL
jgi:hypothetical protein